MTRPEQAKGKRELYRDVKRPFLFQLAFCTAFLLMSAGSIGCNGDEGPNDNLSPRERAKKNILDSLVVPPEAEFKNVKVLENKNMLIASYGSKQSIDFISKFFSDRIKREGFEILQEGEQGFTYENKEGKQIGVLWFPRDPDLSEYKCVFRISYMPLPPELRESPEKKQGEKQK